MSKKRIHYSCEGRIEKSVPRDHRLSSLGKPRDAKRRSSGQIFLSYPHTHGGFLYSCTPDQGFPFFYPYENFFISLTPYKPMGKIKIEQPHIVRQVTSLLC